MIDVNVFLSRWPFRRLPNDDSSRLVARLRDLGVTEAWAGSFDALLHRDVAEVNARLATACRNHGEGLLVPFGTVNLTLPDWEDDLRRCIEKHEMPGIRLHPNYHQFNLDDPRFASLLDQADERGLIVQIAVKMEDERTQHPLVQVPPTDLKPLTKLLASRPKLKVVLLNAFRTLTRDDVARLATTGNVSFDIAMLEGVGGIANQLATLPHERLLFGSLTPLFTLEAALLKLRESELGHTAVEAISSGNARRLRGTD